MAWLLAGAHLASQHGGDHWVCHEVTSPDDGHDDDSIPMDGHHHHDLGAVPAKKTITVQEQVGAPVGTPSGETLPARFTALLRLTGATHSPTARNHSPPDARSTGWLFVAHTALPVRGPSLAA